MSFLDCILEVVCYYDKQRFLMDTFKIPNNKKCRRCSRPSEDLFCLIHFLCIDYLIIDFVKTLDCEKELFRYYSSETQQKILNLHYLYYLEDYLNSCKFNDTFEECIICLETKDTITFSCCRLLCCKMCIYTWLIVNNTCPICRTHFYIKN